MLLPEQFMNSLLFDVPACFGRIIAAIFYLMHTPPEMHDCIFDKWQEEEVQKKVALDLFCFFWQGYNTRSYLFTRTLSFCEFNVIEE